MIASTTTLSSVGATATVRIAKGKGLFTFAPAGVSAYVSAAVVTMDAHGQSQHAVIDQQSKAELERLLAIPL